MDSITTLAKAIKYSCITLAIIVFLCIWPFGLIRIGKTVKSAEVIATESQAVNVEHHIDQMFTATDGDLNSVDLYVVNDMSNQTVTFRLYDDNHEQIFERFYEVPEDFTGDGFIHIPVRYQLEGGKDYYFIIEGLSADMYVAFEERATADTVNYFMTYGEEEMPEYDVIIRYNYACNATWWQLLIFAISFAAVCFVVALSVKKLPDRQVKVRSVFRWIFNPVLAGFGLWLFCEVIIKGVFDVSKKNNIMIILAYWLVLAIMAYIVNFGHFDLLPKWALVLTDDNKDKNAKAYLSKAGEVLKAMNLGKYLRIVSLATVLWYCYDYMNGLYDIFHHYSISKLAIAFLFFLIFTYSKKELLNIPNAVWLVVGPILGVIYYKPMIGEPELEELYRLNAWVIAVGGFVVINLVYSVIRLVKKQVVIPKLNKMFLIPFGVFAVGICALCNTREWPWMLVVMCLLVIHRLIFGENRAEFSKELCSGIVLNFYMMVWFSFKHRPYYYYQFSRYSMGYHTVTVAAYYLAMIACASCIRLFDCIKTKNKVFIVTRLFTFGMSVAFLIFTMSRTGFLSLGMSLLFALILWSICKKAGVAKTSGAGTAKTAEASVAKTSEADVAKPVEGGASKQALKVAGLMFAAVIFMFPVTYGFVDTMPRLFNDPITFEYEYRDFTFYEGMPLVDDSYMTIGQFFHVFKEKVFGISSRTDAKLEQVVHPFTIYAYAANEAEDAAVDEYEDEDYDDDDEIDYEGNGMVSEDMSNGRFTIFKCYLANMNMWGHDEMGTLLPDGEIAVHAHNTFIQVMYDHGIIFGIYFVLFIGYILVYSIIRAYKSRADLYKMFCPVILVCFGMASLVEWVMHPCNPLGLTVFLAMMPLCIRDGENEKVH